MQRAWLLASILVPSWLSMPACSSKSSSSLDACSPGESVACRTAAGCDGFKLCGSNGKYGACECTDGGAGSGGSAGGGGGGDGGAMSGGAAGKGTGGGGAAGSAGKGGNAGESAGGSGGAGSGGVAGSAGSAGTGGEAAGAPNGTPCSSPTMCASGSCVNDHCCDSTGCGDNASCTTGTCACVGSFRNCDGAWNNGCEINVNNDNDHCGDCNAAACQGERYECCGGTCYDLCNSENCSTCFGCTDESQCFANMCGQACP